MYYYSTDSHLDGISASENFNLTKKTIIEGVNREKNEHYATFYVDAGTSYEVFLQYEKIPDKYTINFNGNAETSVGSMDSITANWKEPVQLTKNAFTNKGYDFTGWYLQDDDTGYWYGYNTAMIPGWYPENKLIRDTSGKPWKILVEDEAWLNSTTATITKVDTDSSLSIGSTIVVYDSSGKEVAREVTNDAGRITAKHDMH